jgi:GNAT superfamily N-acetyltransferase
VKGSHGVKEVYMSYRIREATGLDIDVLSDIIRNSFRDVAERFGLTAENCPRHPSNCTREWIVSAMEKGVRHFVLETDETPCGCAALEQVRPEVCYLERLSVLPDFRHTGFGTELVKHLIEISREIGSRQVEIGIIASDLCLKSWYENLGFSQTHTGSFAHLPFEVAFMVNVFR